MDVREGHDRGGISQDTCKNFPHSGARRPLLMKICLQFPDQGKVIIDTLLTQTARSFDLVPQFIALRTMDNLAENRKMRR